MSSSEEPRVWYTKTRLPKYDEPVDELMAKISRDYAVARYEWRTRRLVPPIVIDLKTGFVCTKVFPPPSMQ